MNVEPEEFMDALDFALEILECCDGEEEEDERHLAMVKKRLLELRRRIGVANDFVKQQRMRLH